MGFCPVMVSLIMSCVSSVSYSILFNGTPLGHITPSRGIRYGDPLSYLFMLCIQGLVSLLKDSIANSRIEVIKICRGVPQVNHILFTDDSIIFYKANRKTKHKIQKVLDIYGKTSGQRINQEKTTMVFSQNVVDSTKAELSSIWHTSVTLQYNKYLLGLPPMANLCNEDNPLDSRFGVLADEIKKTSTPI